MTIKFNVYDEVTNVLIEKNIKKCAGICVLNIKTVMRIRNIFKKISPKSRTKYVKV